MKTTQLLVILLIIAFVIVVILVGSGVIFGKAFAQIDYLEDMWVLQITVWHRPLLFGSSSRAPDNIMPTLGFH